MNDNFERPPDHEARVAAARERACWDLGSGYWADLLIGAYFDPEGARAKLARDKEAVRRGD